MPDVTISDTLLGDVKSYVNITWQDDETDKKVTGMIKRGMARLKNIAGVPALDFESEDLPKTLLLDYCRYANSHALEMFETNFQSELVSLHFMCQVGAMGTSEGSETSS